MLVSAFVRCRVYPLVFVGWLVLFGLSLSAQTSLPLPTPLEPGNPLERDLFEGQSHNYQIKLQAGQFARLAIEQLTKPVLLKFFAPDGKLICEIENGWNHSLQAILVAAATGAYRLTVLPSRGSVYIGSGHYEVLRAELRQATEEDQRRYQSQNLFAEALSRGYMSDEKEQEQGVKLAQEWLQLYRSDGDTHSIVEILRLLGYHSISQHNFEKAAEYHQQMIALVRQAGDLRELGNGLEAIGYHYYYNQEFQKAVEYTEQSLFIWRSLGNRKEQAVTLRLLGESYLKLRQIEKAIECYTQLLTAGKESHDPKAKATALHAIGDAYKFLGEQERALEYHFQALQIARAGGAKLIEAHLLDELPDLIASKEGFVDAADLLRRHGRQSQQLIAMYERSRDLFRKLNVPTEAKPLLSLALWHSFNGERKTALEEIERAMLMNPKGSRNLKSQIGEKIADVYSVLGNYQQAIKLRERVYQEFQGDLDDSANLLVGLAVDLRNANRLKEARERFEEAIRIKESLRARLSNQEDRTSVSFRNARAYELYTDLLMQLHQQKPEQELVENAFLATERARARSLLDLLNEARAEIRSGVDPTLLASERRLQQKINWLTSRPNDSQKNEQPEAIQKELTAAFDELRQVRAASPRYAELIEPPPLILAKIQNELLDADTLLLAYSLGEVRSFVWVLTPNSIKSYQLPSRAEITTASRRVYDLLSAPQQMSGLPVTRQQTQLAKAEKKYQTEAAALSQILLGPVASQLGTKRLLIVAPEALEYLPFATLPESSVVSRPS